MAIASYNWFTSAWMVSSVFVSISICYLKLDDIASCFVMRHYFIESQSEFGVSLARVLNTFCIGWGLNR
jgi:hypothetical protein